MVDDRTPGSGGEHVGRPVSQLLPSFEFARWTHRLLMVGPRAIECKRLAVASWIAAYLEVVSGRSLAELRGCAAREKWSRGGKAMEEAKETDANAFEAGSTGPLLDWIRLKNQIRYVKIRLLSNGHPPTK